MYKLINKQTGEEHLCDKVTIDGFDYYVSDSAPKENDYVYSLNSGKIGKVDKDYQNGAVSMKFGESYTEAGSVKNFKKVIATTNPNIDIPKVVDEVEMLAHSYFAEERYKWEQEHPDALKSPPSLVERYSEIVTPLYKAGYNKSQETHPFSEEDMIEFGMYRLQVLDTPYENYPTKKLLQFWKEQRPKIVYYE